jgi:hypothetical protein
MNYAIAFAFAINISIIRSSCRVWRSYIVEITKIHHDITDCAQLVAKANATAPPPIAPLCLDLSAQRVRRKPSNLPPPPPALPAVISLL